MTFKPEKVEEFITVFERYKSKIKNAPGCTSLELIRNLDIPHQISTLSRWKSVQDLNNYRDSEIFKEVWPLTKIHFGAKPIAQSFSILTEV